MTSIKVKFRPSTTKGKEGSIYYQVIHKRVVRQIKTDYCVFKEQKNAVEDIKHTFLLFTFRFYHYFCIYYQFIVASI